MRRLREDNKFGNCRRERPLDGGEVRLVLPRPDAMGRIVDRTVHAVYQRGWAGKRSVDVA